MTLKDLLKKIDHNNFNVFYQDANVPAEMQKGICIYDSTSNDMTLLSEYLECLVLFISEDWQITIRGEII